MEGNRKVKVRFAPSPTGIPHIGNTRTALFNYIFAKHNSGEFILRIEDTDRKRIVKGAEEAILNILNWLGLDYSKDVIHQSERLEMYKKYVQELLDKKIAHKKEGAIWIKIPDDKQFKWNDLVGNKEISFSGKDQEDFVILKSDGYPTYHLANVVDDHLMEISHVIRGEEWISSTPKHIYLYESFGWDKPFFAHLPVILGTDRSKLSKRHGAKSVLDYKEDGYLKETLINYMALLGWNPGGDKEQMNIDKIIELFDLKDVNTANPIFDIQKLEWLNGLWIRILNEQKELRGRLEEYYKKDKNILTLLNSDNGYDLVDAASSRMRTLAEFKSLVNFERERKKNKQETEVSKKLLSFLTLKLKDDWKDNELLLTIKEFSKSEGVPFKTIFFLMTGKEKGIGILELNKIFGKDFFINNLK